GALTPIDTQGRTHPTQSLTVGGQFSTTINTGSDTETQILAAPSSGGFAFAPIYRLHSWSSPDLAGVAVTNSLILLDGNGAWLGTLVPGNPYNYLGGMVRATSILVFNLVSASARVSLTWDAIAPPAAVL